MQVYIVYEKETALKRTMHPKHSTYQWTDLLSDCVFRTSTLDGRRLHGTTVFYILSHLEKRVSEGLMACGTVSVKSGARHASRGRARA